MRRTRKSETEVSREQRLANEAQARSDADAADKAIDKMVRENIKQHGA